MARPLSILHLTETSISLDVTALNSVLKKVGNRPFVFYSVNGKFRKGKSLLLNFFLQYLEQNSGTKSNPEWFKPQEIRKNFHWRGGAAADTSGINVWSEPFVIRRDDGRDLCILLMDTQGSFDDKTSTHQNAVVFALSALLSSVVIMNVERDVSDDMLQFFRFFTSFAQLALENESNPELSLDEDSFFQNLIFLVRDFEWYRDYPLGHHGDETVDPNFKKARLFPSRDRSVENNFLREQILLTFSQIDLFLLPHPGEELAVFDDLTKLKENFQSHLKNFVERAFSAKNLVPKKIAGVEVTGDVFQKYVDGWAKLFRNPDALPNVQSIHDTTATVQNMLAMKDALISYERGMTSFLEVNPSGVEIQVFMAHHLEFAGNSFKVFQKTKRMGGKEYESKFCAELQEEIEPRMEYFKKINDVKLKAAESKRQLLAEQAQLKNKITGIQTELVNFKETSSAERNQLRGELEEMVKKEKEMLEEIQKGNNDREGLVTEQNALRCKINEAEAAVANMQKQQKYKEELDELNRKQNEALQQMERQRHQDNLELTRLQYQKDMEARSRKEKSSWWEAPLQVITMGMASGVAGLFKK